MLISFVIIGMTLGIVVSATALACEVASRLPRKGESALDAMWPTAKADHQHAGVYGSVGAGVSGGGCGGDGGGCG